MDGTTPSLNWNPSDPLKLLGLLAKMSGGMTAVPLGMLSLLDEEAYEKLTASDIKYLTGPLMIGTTVPGGSWTQGMPDWIKDQARTERYRLVMGLMPGHLITPCEIMASLYEASLTAPLRGFEGDLYVWAGCHAIARWKDTTFEEMALRYPEDPPKDRDFIEPNGRHHYDYKLFAQDLRRKVEARAPKVER